jgi:hypothetical protein
MTPEQQLIERIRANWPEELRAMPNWTQWFKIAKPEPGFSGKQPKSGVNRPDTWFTFEDACTKSWKMVDKVWMREEDSPLRSGRGLGFQFFGTDLLPIDLDHIIGKNGAMCSEAAILISKLMTLTEYSVSGTGLHCIGRGKIRQEVVATQHIQFWNPAKGQKRFFTVTGELYSEDFAKLNDCGEEFQMYASHPRIFSVKMQEQLLKIDPEQAASLPPEPDAPQEQMPRERSKTKSRKVHPEFDIYDYLKFNKIPIIKEQNNEPGHCIFVGTCPNHGGTAHAGHNETTANYVYPCTDGGLAYHCHSSGCTDGQFPITKAIARNAELNGVYPKPIYDGSTGLPKRKLFLSTTVMSQVSATLLTWTVDHILLAGALNLFVGDPDIGKTLVAIHYIAKLSQDGKKSVVICREDDYGFVWVPRLWAAGANLDLIIPVHGVGDENDPDYKADWMLDDSTHRDFLKQLLLEEKPALCLIDPLADFAGAKDMNKPADVRDITGPLNKIAKETETAMVVNCHTTKAIVDSAIKSAAGSFQLMAAVQVSWMFMKDPDKEGQRLMLQARNKYGKKRGFKYIVTGVPYREDWPGEKDEDGIGVVEFKGKETRTADELLERNSDKDNGVKTRIRRWLNEMLANGPVSTEQAGKEMEARGFNRNTVSDVCLEMGVERDRKTWSMKKKPQAVEQDEIKFDSQEKKQ